ncbi:hypothetical protein NH340_JMT01020 [Sarcoptes scabiei]|nr:hypothetical protein NH340_JMT01020 [Sarcoptes scabiei]
MNQFNKFKDFVHGNLSNKNDKQILSSAILKEEKHVDNIKCILATADKKLSNSMFSSKGSEQERKTKKYPSSSLNKFFSEASETLSTSKTDSVLGRTLFTCSQLQNEFTRILSDHESFIENECLNRIELYLNEDLPAIHRSRKQLNKSHEELKIAKTKYESLVKTLINNPPGNSETQTKIDTLKKEMDYCEQKLEQCRDFHEILMFDFLSKELSISEIFFQYIKSLEIYHDQMLKQIRHYIPVLNGVLQNSTQKPVFGVPLADHLKASGRTISVVIEQCVEFLWPFVQEEGLFRISGSISKVKRMRNAFNAGRLDALDGLKNDAPAVVSTLKSYLRELPEPLLTFDSLQNWIEASKESDQNERLKAIWKVCNALPDANRENLCFLLKFLNELTKHCEKNKMSSQNLAIAIGPSLLWSRGDSFDLSMSNHLPALIETMITYCDYFFPDETFSYYQNFTKSMIDINSDAMNGSSPTNSNQSNNHVNNRKKTPAPKPPSSVSPIPSSESSTSVFSSTTASKLRSRISSFKFKPNTSANHKFNSDSIKNVSIDNEGFESNQRTESPPALIVYRNNLPEIHFRKSLTPDILGNKVRPKSVCERPSVPPPEIPPRPVLNSKCIPPNIDILEEKYSNLNHIDSESEENVNSVKDFSSNEETKNQYDLSNEISKSMIYPSLDEITDEINEDNLIEYESDSNTESLPSIHASNAPRKPPRANSHSSNSSSNLSLNEPFVPDSLAKSDKLYDDGDGKKIQESTLTVSSQQSSESNQSSSISNIVMNQQTNEQQLRKKTHL